MPNPSAPVQRDVVASSDAGWDVVQAAARAAERLATATERATFALDVQEGQWDLRPVREDDAEAVVAWRPNVGWELLLPDDDPRAAFVDLYLPICGANSVR